VTCGSGDAAYSWFFNLFLSSRKRWKKPLSS